MKFLFCLYTWLFSEYKILDQQLLFSTLKIVYCLLICIGCGEKSTIILIFTSLWLMNIFVFAFKFFTISLIFSKLNMMFFIFLNASASGLLNFLNQWIYNFIRFGKFLVITSSNIIFAPHPTGTWIIYMLCYLHSTLANKCRICILLSAHVTLTKVDI